MSCASLKIIRAELENRVVKTWVYSYRGSDGKQAEGLSKVGVDAACTEMAKTGHIISEGEVKFSIDPTSKQHVLFVGQATRSVLDGDKKVTMETVNGTKRQWIKMKARNGSIVDNPFWFEHGSIKALRNQVSPYTRGDPHQDNNLRPPAEQGAGGEGARPS